MAPQNDKENDVPENESSIKIGRILASPEPGEEVVISGLAGRYPDSEHVYKFRDNLFHKIDMVSGDNRRWKPGHPEIPQRTGKLKDIEKFDAGYFGLHRRHVTRMDPMSRLFLEVAIEAIFDAGLHPSELEGTKTGVFVGACFSESEKTWFNDRLVPQGAAILGCTRSMIANRVSNYLKLKGPSVVCDTACSSSLYALENAYKAIRTGSCDRAIVGGANLCLHPSVSLQFARLGVLSLDGSCKAFDKAGNGYARSEAVSAVVLQKSKEAKRIYSIILHAKTNCDGFKSSGITYPSGEMQERLLREFYQEYCSVKPTDLSFLEAHGTGTKVGDPEELQSVDEVFTKGRSTPLLIGSIKSNIGHTEPSSGLCSITKAIIAFESGYIPPNLHYTSPRPGVKGLEEGRLKVVTDKIPFNDNRGLIGVNSFGFGGGNCHVLLKHNKKDKLNQGRPKDNLPRLVCVSGRNENAVDSLLDDVIGNNFDVEYVRMLHEIFRKDIEEHLFRSYSIVSKSGELLRSSNYKNNRVSHLALCFGTLDETTVHRAREFLELPVSASTFQRIHSVLNPKDLNILSILANSKHQTVLDRVLANFSLQALFADLIRACDIVPEKMFGVSQGFSLGALVCAYFDDALTLEEATECAYHIAYTAHAVSCSDGIDVTSLSDLSVLLNGSNAIKLQGILATVLKAPRKLSDRVVCDMSHSVITPEGLVNSLADIQIVGSVQSVVKKNWSLMEIGNGDLSRKIDRNQKFNIRLDGGIVSVLSTLGRLYEIGFNPQIQHLYPKIEFPVSRGTPMISPRIKWNHDRKWWITSYDNEQVTLEEKKTRLIVNDPTFAFIKGHVVDGRNLVPATGYLLLVWETLAHIHGLMITDMKVIFENCKFRRATAVPKEGTRLELIVMIQRGTGNFEVIDGVVPVVTGKIHHQLTEEVLMDELPIPCGVRKEIAPYFDKKGVYKELRLRGYNYKGQFRGIQSCDSSAEIANIVWEANWITFMDCMLQMKILQEDTRLLYVPTNIRKIVIDAKRHIECAKNIAEENPLIPTYCHKDTGIIRSGGIQISGLIASSIARRRYTGVPVLEKYVFVPNRAFLRTEQAIRVDMQILLENIPSIKVKVVELIDEATVPESQPLGDIIFDVLGDQPMIHPDITILSKNEIEVQNVKVEDKKLLTEVDCSLVVGSKILQRNNILQIALGSIKEKGFILSRESLDFEEGEIGTKEVSVITVFNNGEEKLVLFKKIASFDSPIVIHISESDDTFSWIPKLQKALEKDNNILVYAQGEPLNGALGLVSCIRREPRGQNVRLFFMPGLPTPELDLNLTFFSDQLAKNLAFNVYKDDQWGTYRHLLLDEVDKVEADHCYLNSLQRGILSSLSWVEGPLQLKKNIVGPDESLVYVHYAAINFRDVMTASGKINVDSITRDRREQECVQGFEFSGITESGTRVMGMAVNGACASIVVAHNVLLWEVPDQWTLQEAVTVPVVYLTALIGLITKGKLKRGETVLIHSGTGGVGLAAIQIALHFGATVYTTVGTPEKREFLKKRYPQLKDDNISNSRTTEFEQHVLKMTKGRGVDVVLNSLAEEKLFASVRSLARGGRFVEIGKFDLANDNTLDLLLLEKGATFHGLMVDCFKVNEMAHTLQKYLKQDVIRPLPSTVFKMDEPEVAFRYMTTGKHMGKVILEVRTEEPNKSTNLHRKFPCIPRYYCDPDKTYIICGGLGGFGLELADWLALRGCKNLVLTSRIGIRTGYQAYRVSIWRSYGCQVVVSTDDITTYEGCVQLIEKANKHGPVHAIFNLAVVLKDAIFDNQSEESFKTSFGPKANATRHLDSVTRSLCPELRDFVVFSSVSCGRGNGGQTNYGMSNSVMERICEKRRNEGLPALAIEWGAVGDVGLVADMQEEAIEIEIGGTLQQRISNCLEVLDSLLKQKDAAIVSSIVVAEKKSGLGGADNIVDAVAIILGIKDLKSVSLQATLAEVGMDSMTAVEIKQTLEREYDVFLTPQDIKTMTFGKLVEIQAQRDAEKQSGVKKEKAVYGMDILLQSVQDEQSANLLSKHIQGSAEGSSSSRSTVVVFPGLEGLIGTISSMYPKINANILGLQYPVAPEQQRETIEEMAEMYVPLITEGLPKDQPFKIISYSFGSIVAIETVKLLEELGYSGTLILIDGAPHYLKDLSKLLDAESEEKLQVSLLVQLATFNNSSEILIKNLDLLFKCNTFEEKIKLAQSFTSKNSEYSADYLKDCAVSLYNRLRAVVKWYPDFKLKHTKVALFKASLASTESPEEFSGLSALCEQPVDVRVFDGNHVTVVQNPEMCQAINEMLELVEEKVLEEIADAEISGHDQ